MSATCTFGPTATTGERCGRPAVTTFTGSRGESFAECAEHAFHSAAEDIVAVHRHGRTYQAKVVKRGSRGAVYAEVTYNNGVKRVVRV